MLRGRHGLIVGNSHSHRGHFGVFFPDTHSAVAAQVGELDDMSEQSRYWLTGFLAGSEPSLYEYVGMKADEPTLAEEARWAQFNERFRKRGSAERFHRWPSRALVVADDERGKIRAAPWTFVAERTLVPDGDRWVEAEPQLETHDGWLARSICAAREYHDTMELRSGWTVCLDCGEVTDS